MSSDAAIELASLWLTYLIRSSGAYLLLWVLCRLIQNSHLRFRLYGIFLGGIVAAWLGLLLTSLSVVFTSNSTSPAIVPHPLVPHPYRSWPLNPALAPFLAAFLPRARWIYVPVLTFLLLQFCTHLWQLRTFLRASQPATETLSFLLELVRSETNGPRCEVRLVPGLRSPAATGWWRPKVLLPDELLPRLEAQQLVYVLRHELMHVRRRDYLWDRLATLGCYVVFFNPWAWLARRRLRWERELVCDEDVVERSRERRLEYAGCLTTLASWWFLEEEIAGPVDFLSSPPSLLAARVRALLACQTTPYSGYKKAAVGLSATAALSLVVWLVPEIAVTFSGSAPRNAVRFQRFPRSAQTITRTDRQRMSKRHKLFASVATSPALDARSAPPYLEFPINLPVLSGPSVVESYQFMESVASVSPVGSGSRGELDTVSRPTGSIWDESPPHTTPSRASKIGRLAERAVRLGVALVGVGIGDHEHEKEH
jgi:beta-lactamase regulating signal transducer with metallopeptidase domain